MAEKFTIPLINKEQIAQDTFSFYFDLVNIPEFNFIPGQYIRMILPHVNPDERGTSRFFTISSSPDEKKHLMITTKIVQSTFKIALGNISLGDEVQFFGPMGNFILDESEKAPRIYLAGGIGITPFHSMLRYSYVKEISIPQTLFVSFSTPEEIIFANELGNITEKSEFLRAFYTVTRPAESKIRWEGLVGRIDEELIKKNLTLTGNEIYYICGPTAMVDAMREMVQKMGIPGEQIREEHFNGY